MIFWTMIWTFQAVTLSDEEAGVVFDQPGSQRIAPASLAGGAGHGNEGNARPVRDPPIRGLPAPGTGPGDGWVRETKSFACGASLPHCGTSWMLG